MSAVRLWLVAYDVREPKRLMRLHRRLACRALALQYSVFLFGGDRRAREALEREIAPLVRPEDDLRIYPLPPGTKLRLYGPGPLPEGVLWVDEALERLLRRTGQ